MARIRSEKNTPKEICTMLTLSLVLGSLLMLLAAGWRFETLGERADARRFPPLGRLVDVGTHRLHLVHKGPSGGPTVVIEQGAGEPWIFWWAIVERVAKFASVCSYDRAGIGSSDAACAAYTPLDSARELHTLLERARIPGPYILVAHSYGGLIARLFARDHQRDVAGLVLVDTFEEGIHFRPDVLPMYRRFRWMLAMMTFAARFGILRLIAKVRKPEASTLPAEIHARTEAVGHSPAFFRGMSTDMKILDRYDTSLRQPGATGRLGDLPLVVITHGQAFPGPMAILEKYWEAGQRRLAALSTRGELVVARNSNHMVQLDEPDVVIGAIERVLAAARGTGAPARAAAPV
jgi:pimeloyl-ACP methyl ester carboxylesterase